jgi:hypothetical protein
VARRRKVNDEPREEPRHSIAQIGEVADDEPCEEPSHPITRIGEEADDEPRDEPRHPIARCRRSTLRRATRRAETPGRAV